MSHRYLMAALSIVAVLLAAGPLAGTASAQDISFTLDDERLLVTVNKDGSVDLNYTFSFGNVTYLDGVDIGLPNEHYNLLTATATIVVGGEERRLTDIRESPFIDVGVAVEFDEDTMNEIVSAGEFELKFHVNNPQMVYRNEMREGTAGVVVRPTWFSEEFQTGPTARMNVTILLPEGMSNRSEVLWLESDPFDPIYVDEATGRLAASWQFINVPPSQQASGAYDVGVGFPEHYVDVVFDPPQGDLLGDLGELICLLMPLIIIAAIIGIVIVSARSANRRREDYFEPKMNVVGAGPRRDLTAVEAAVVAERPLEMVATMILFGLERKGMVKVLSDERLMKLQRLVDRGEHEYETNYMLAITADGTLDRVLLRHALVQLINETSKKLKGFDLDATRRYYEGIAESVAAGEGCGDA